MKLRRRGPFDELVERQLSLFAEDDAELLQEAEEAEAAWNAIRARREERLKQEKERAGEPAGNK